MAGQNGEQPHDHATEDLTGQACPECAQYVAPPCGTCRQPIPARAWHIGAAEVIRINAERVRVRNERNARPSALAHEAIPVSTEEIEAEQQVAKLEAELAAATEAIVEAQRDVNNPLPGGEYVITGRDQAELEWIRKKLERAGTRLRVLRNGRKARIRRWITEHFDEYGRPREPKGDSVLDRIRARTREIAGVR